MGDVYVICAIVGGTIFLCQLTLSLLGIGGEHDFSAGDHDIGHDFGHGDHGGQGEHADHNTVFMHMFSLRAIVAFVTFFGLTGMAVNKNEMVPLLAVAISLAGGLAAMFAVGCMMSFLYKLHADGTVRIEQALGKTGTVYLTIPPKMGGPGKVTLNVQDRTMEYLAVTASGELPMGAKVVVVDIVSSDTVAVTAVPEEEKC